MKRPSRRLGWIAVLVLALGGSGCSDAPNPAALTFQSTPGIVISEAVDVWAPSIDVRDASDGEVGDAAPSVDTVPSADTTPDIDISDGATGDVDEDVPPGAPCEAVEDCEDEVALASCEAATCLPSGVCGVVPVDDGSSCDDGDACTELETCGASGCVGVPVSCEASDVCNQASCEPATGCVETPVTNGTPCDDGLPCTLVDVCQDGVCGSDETCDCEQDMDCEDDGDLCNGLPTCVEGVCAVDPSTVAICPDGDACTTFACQPATGACEPILATGASCTLGTCFETGECVEGVCEAEAKTCDDENTCTSDTCDVDTGDCVHEDLGAVPCDDGDLCTVGDACVATVCGGLPKSCDDGDVCTQDDCQPASGCVSAPLSCDDGDLCTTDACEPAKGCVWSAVSCVDGDACTGEACDVAQGCTYAPTICDDANTCTLDTCVSPTGCTTLPVDCSDGDPCTLDTCDPVLGCQHAPDPCDDDNQCTDDACDAVEGCVTSPIDCGETDLCSTFSCDPVDGCILGDVVCDDGDACTSDACDPLSGCVTSPIVCDDGDICTVDGCDVVAGCQTKPLVCDDGALCTQDSCDPATGCVTKPLVCDDGEVCTVDSCDPASGCVTKPLACDDGDLCTTDACDPVAGCISTAVTCPDGGPCEEEVCDPTTGDCVSKPTPALQCDDGDICTEGDLCVGNLCVGKPVDCDDDNPCTDDACGAQGCVSVASEGGSCDDPSVCTSGSCEGGICVSVDDCDDDDPCTIDGCDGAGGCLSKPNPDCVSPQCEDVPAGTACDDAADDTVADMCISGICRGFTLAQHQVEPAFGNLSYDTVGEAEGEWSVTAHTDGSNFATNGIVNITDTDLAYVYDGTAAAGGAIFKAQWGRYIVDTTGRLFEFDGVNWLDDSPLAAALSASGTGQLYGVWATESSGEPTVWVVGNDASNAYVRRCTADGCDVQKIVLGGNATPLPRAVAGHDVCGPGGCKPFLAAGVDEQNWNNYVSHTFENPNGIAPSWNQTFDDPGASQDQTRAMMAYGDGRYLIVGDDGYMRYRDLTGWQNAVNTAPNLAARTFTGVWASGDLILVSATINGPNWNTRTLELWTIPKSADPTGWNSWTIHTLGTFYDTDTSLNAIAGSDTGEIRVVGTGAGQWNAYRSGLVYIRTP